MDLHGATGPTTTAAAVSAESTLAAAKKDVVAEKKENEATTPAGKNGSTPDSTESRIAEAIETNEKTEKNLTNEESKCHAKQAVTTTASADSDVLQDKIVPNTADPADLASSSSARQETPAVEEDENDDLLLRLEALEKGEDPELVGVAKKNELAEINHQNGLVEKSNPGNPQNKSKDTDIVGVSSGSGEKSTPSSVEPQVAVEQTPREAVSSDHIDSIANKEGSAATVQIAIDPNAKRKHALSEPEVNNEPITKKVHVGNITDGVEASASKGSVEKTVAPPSKTPDEESNAKSAGPTPSEVESMEATTEKPPSVEKMDVDASPEPETSSPENLETLPDTESNTEPEEISSSVAEEPTRSALEDKSSGKSDHSNVSSSDDKRCGSHEKAKAPDSEVSASVIPTPSEDEPMDVDGDEVDVAESTSAATVTGVPVVEPPCIKKVAYLCTEEEDTPDGLHKDSNRSSTEPTAESRAEVISSVASKTPNAPPSTSQVKVVKADVDIIPAKANNSSSASIVKVAALSEAGVVDSSQKVSIEKPPSDSTNSSANAVDSKLDESAVESSQPTSSSDSKKQSTENRQANEQLREVVHRGGLLAKASSSPNSSAAVLSVSSPSTPRTLNSVTTSAVSSSNVYSSTPIHENFLKASAGSLGKISNPPSSVETSRVEADDTTTATNTPSSDQSALVGAEEGTEKGASSTASPSTAKSSLSVTPSKVETIKVLPGTTSLRSSPPKKDLLKREESYSASSSSLKTTDMSEVDSCTVVSAMNTAEEINMYAANARKFNGISSTSEGSELDVKEDVLKSLKPAKVEDDAKTGLSSTVLHLDLSGAISPSTSSEQQYEVSVWYDGKDLQFLSVERIHRVKVESLALDPGTTGGTTAVTQDTSSIIDSSSKQTSSTTTTNGSVSSLGPFPLSEKRSSVADATAHSSDSSSTSAGAPAGNELHSVTKAASNVPQMKQTVKGPIALCDLLIEEMIKLRRSFVPEDDMEYLMQTPKGPGSSARGQRSGSSTAKKSTSSARGQKRSKAADSDEDDEAANEPRTPRGSASSASKQPAKKVKSVESPTVSSTAAAKPKSTSEPTKNQFDICCLARWTDRKYYAGRVTNYRGDNKYVVVFEDGCSKTLSRDIIVFGEDGILPILNHSIHALTGGDTYEPAIVEEIKRSGGDSGDVVYAVRTASSALEVTATDIYLTDEQAKWIHNALKDKPDPMQQLLQSETGVESEDHGGGGGDGSAADGVKKVEGSAARSEHVVDASGGDKSARSTRSKRGAGDKTPVTPEAGYSGGIGKKGRRGRRKQLPPPESNISECSDVSDGYEDEVPNPVSPETGLDAVDGVQPELQRTELESELAKMELVSLYFGDKMSARDETIFNDLLGPIPVGSKTLFRNKHFLLSCTIPLKKPSCNGDSADASKYKQFSNIPFVKQHLRRQIEAGGGKVYQFFEDVPKNKYKLCKLIAPRPSTTALYVQCLACDIPAVSHEWIVQCCRVLMLVDHKPYALPCGWSFLEKRYIDWGSGRIKDKRNSVTPFASTSINVASLCKDFNDFWSRVCKLGGATVRLIKTDSDVTENLTGYLLTDQEFPEDIKIKAARNGLLVVSTVWVVQCLILGSVCHPKSHEKLTQIYQEEDY